MRAAVIFLILMLANISHAAELPLQKPASDAALFPMYLPALGQDAKLQFVQGPALVNIFATWCGPCMAEHSQLLALHQQLKLPIYGIALHDDPAHVTEHLAKDGNPYSKIFLDDKGLGLQMLGMDSVPITLLIDAQQRVHWLITEPIMPAMLPALTQQIASEMAQSAPPSRPQNLHPITFANKSSPAR